MKIVFSWSTISGYMAACWRNLNMQDDIELFVVAHKSKGNTAFSDELLKGIPHRLLDSEEQNDSVLVEKIIKDEKPDIVAMTGWWLKPHRDLAKAEKKESGAARDKQGLA